LSFLLLFCLVFMRWFYIR